MSWQPYVDDSLIGHGFHHGCITSHEGAVWASTPDFRIKAKEAVRVGEALDGNLEAIQSIRESGFSLSGVNYALSRFEVDDDEVRYLIGRCKDTGEPSRGIVVARTTRTLLFGVHDPLYARGVSFEKCNTAIYALAELLIGMSF